MDNHPRACTLQAGRVSRASHPPHEETNFALPRFSSLRAVDWETGWIVSLNKDIFDYAAEKILHIFSYFQQVLLGN